MTLKPILLAGLLLALAACVNTADYPALRNIQFGSDAAIAVNELARVADLSPDQRRRELAALENGRVDDMRRFQAAALLDREDSVEALERGLKNLNAITNVDGRVQAVLEQMRKSFKARIELKQQTVRAQELQDKLEQIKTLEKTLQQRTVPPVKP